MANIVQRKLEVIRWVFLSVSVYVFSSTASAFVAIPWVWRNPILCSYWWILDERRSSAHMLWFHVFKIANLGSNRHQRTYYDVHYDRCMRVLMVSEILKKVLLCERIKMSVCSVWTVNFASWRSSACKTLHGPRYFHTLAFNKLTQTMM